MARQPLGGLGRLIFLGFTMTLFRHTTFGRTPLDGGPARRRDLYLTTYNTHKRQTSMPPVGFEATIVVSERPQTHALDRTGHWDRQLFVLAECIVVRDHYHTESKCEPFMIWHCLAYFSY
jgi:hypothetical protein